MVSSCDKILVIKLGALGDFIQALGPMKAIKHHHKKAHITLLTTKSFADFAQKCGYFDEVLIDKRPRWFDLPGWIALCKSLNGSGFDRVYDLQNNDRSSFYFRLFSPKPEWVGIAKGASHRNISPQRTAGHAFDGHVQTLGLAGIKKIEPDTLEWMESDISRFNLTKPYVLLVPGCAPSRPEKRWPPASYGRLAAYLVGKGIAPVIIGTDAEQQAAEEIAQACPQVINLISQTNLYEIATLARGAIGAVGNDTGPMHLIGSTGIPSLVLFSAHSNPVKHAPKGNHVHVLQKDELQDVTCDDVIQSLPFGNGQKSKAV